MGRKELLIVVALFLIVFTTAFFIYLSVRQKVLFSPQEENLPPIEIINMEEVFCYDSDEGLNYFQNGVVLWGKGDGEFHKSYDYCSIDDPLWEEGTIFEMYCLGDSFKIKSVRCLGVCEDGVCVD